MPRTSKNRESVQRTVQELSEMSLGIKRKLPLTIGEEIDASVEETYRIRGMSVPEADTGWGKTYDAELRAEYDKDLSTELYQFCYGKKNPTPAPPKPVEVSSAGLKPEFGTPEFWAWARRRKLEKEKEAAVKAAEKEAAKAAKDAAKAAEAAAKEAAKKAKADAKATVGTKSKK